MSDNRDFIEDSGFEVEEISDTEQLSDNSIAEELPDSDNAEESSIDAPQKPEGESSLDQTEESKKPFAEAVDWVGSLVYAVLFMLVLNLFLFRSITVSGESMNNTLQDADRVISTNLFYTPQRGDIVVVQADRLKPRGGELYGEPIIKRVIAVEGDTISFDFDEGIVWVNGEKLEEDYIAQPTYAAWNRVSGFEYEVPEGHVFVMGDNRNASTDSRDIRVGFVDTDLIMGKAIFRYFPFDSMGSL